MTNLNLFTRVIAYLTVSAGIIWLGSYIARLSVTYQLFETDGITIKGFVEGKTLDGIIILLTPTIFLTFISYLIMIIGFSLFLFTAKINMKNNGWILILTLIIFISLPLEAYQMTLDWKFIQSYSSGNNSQNLNFIIERLQTLQGFSLIMIVCYLAIPYLLLFKPFTLKKT